MAIIIEDGNLELEAEHAEALAESRLRRASEADSVFCPINVPDENGRNRENPKLSTSPVNFNSVRSLRISALSPLDYDEIDIDSVESNLSVASSPISTPAISLVPAPSLDIEHELTIGCSESDDSQLSCSSQDLPTERERKINNEDQNNPIYMTAVSLLQYDSSHSMTFLFKLKRNTFLEELLLYRQEVKSLRERLDTKKARTYKEFLPKTTVNSDARTQAIRLTAAYETAENIEKSDNFQLILYSLFRKYFGRGKNNYHLKEAFKALADDGLWHLSDFEKCANEIVPVIESHDHIIKKLKQISDLILGIQNYTSDIDSISCSDKKNLKENLQSLKTFLEETILEEVFDDSLIAHKIKKTLRQHLILIEEKNTAPKSKDFMALRLYTSMIFFTTFSPPSPTLKNIDSSNHTPATDSGRARFTSRRSSFVHRDD